MNRRFFATVAVLCMSAAVANGQRIYWVDNENLGSTVIRSANLDGSDVFNEVGVAGRQLRDIEVDPSTGWIYWSDEAMIIRIRDDSGGGVRLIDSDHPNMGSPMGIALDPARGKLYWVDGGDGTIKRMGLDLPLGETPQNRTDVETLVTGFVGLELFAGIDVPKASSIPAVGTWGIAIMGIVVLCGGTVAVMKKRQAV